MRLHPLLVCFVALTLLAVAAPAQSDSEHRRPEWPDKLQNPPNMVDKLYTFTDVADWDAGELSRVKIEARGEQGEAFALVLADDRDRSFPKRGRWLSPEIEPDFAFTELVPSWIPETPDETGMTFEFRVRDQASGEWSPWLYLGQWGTTVHWPKRTIEYENGEVRTDYIQLGVPAGAFQAKVDFYSYDLSRTAQPALRRLTVALSGQVNDDARRAELTEPVEIEGEWARDLGIPFRAQGIEDPAIRGSICSPTSISMVMSYYGVDRPTVENAMRVWDPEYAIFGNWPRNVARAGELGFDGWIDRFRSWDEVKAEIAKGRPVVASIRFEEGTFPSSVMDSTNGHLIVIRGFTPEGDVIVNDPASKDRGDGPVYVAEELAGAWFDKGGVGYVIVPRDGQAAAGDLQGAMSGQ